MPVNVCVKRPTLIHAKSAFRGPKSRLATWKTLSTVNMCHQLIKDMGTNMLTLQPSQLSLQIRTFVTTSIILVIAVYSYDLLRYFIPS